jgi:predicted transposase YbfD/YdcC
MTFREDACRVRQPLARENLAVLRHIALSRLKGTLKNSPFPAVPG